MADINPKEKNFLVLKVSGALLFHVFAFMGFFFSVWRGNWNSAAWCVVLELCCTMVIVFSKNHLKGELPVKYSARFFRILLYVSAAACIGSFGAFVAYVAVGTVQHETFDVKSHYAAAPVAIIASFWYGVLFFDCRKYVSLLE